MYVGVIALTSLLVFSRGIFINDKLENPNKEILENKLLCNES